MPVARDGERWNERDGFWSTGKNHRLDSGSEIHLSRRRQRLFRTLRRLRQESESAVSLGDIPVDLFEDIFFQSIL